MTTIKFIGDVHGGLKGNMDRYIGLTRECDSSIQLGDFGAGFVNLPYLGLQHKFIRGNHDNPALCKEHPNWIEDGTFENDIFYVGGAFSIDKDNRLIGRDWWDDEELSYDEFYRIMDDYEKAKPKVMVTHDAPNIINNLMFPRYGINNKTSRTSNALEAMLEIHQPENWFFGHWHRTVNLDYKGTHFMCLAELDSYDLKLSYDNLPKV